MTKESIGGFFILVAQTNCTGEKKNKKISLKKMC